MVSLNAVSDQISNINYIYILAIADQTAGPNWMEFLLTLYLEPLDDEAHGGELTAPVANQLVTQGTREHLNNQSNPIKKLNQIKNIQVFVFEN